MRGATRAMGAMNKQMNLPALTKIMREFERQNERMEMTSEMMGDAVDDAFEVLLASVSWVAQVHCSAERAPAKCNCLAYSASPSPYSQPDSPTSNKALHEGISIHTIFVGILVILAVLVSKLLERRTSSGCMGCISL